jgi:hypothetical protein
MRSWQVGQVAMYTCNYYMLSVFVLTSTIGGYSEVAGRKAFRVFYTTGETGILKSR